MAEPILSAMKGVRSPFRLTISRVWQHAFVLAFPGEALHVADMIYADTICIDCMVSMNLVSGFDMDQDCGRMHHRPRVIPIPDKKDREGEPQTVQIARQGEADNEIFYLELE